jgi:hypothetical protein
MMSSDDIKGPKECGYAAKVPRYNTPLWKEVAC